MHILTTVCAIPTNYKVPHYLSENFKIFGIIWDNLIENYPKINVSQHVFRHFNKDCRSGKIDESVM